MTINKIPIAGSVPAAAYRGPIESKQLHAALSSLSNGLNTVADQWNNTLVPLLQNLPSASNPQSEDQNNLNPWNNSFDGKNLYLDATATPLVDNGRFYLSSLSRPMSIKEALTKIETDIYTKINEINKLSTSSGITSAQKSAIGNSIFDTSLSSSPNSLSGKVDALYIRLSQLSSDVWNLTDEVGSDNDYAFEQSGKQTKSNPIQKQINDILDILSDIENRLTALEAE